jgi:hypothetical protein
MYNVWPAFSLDEGIVIVFFLIFLLFFASEIFPDFGRRDISNL